MIKLQAHRGVSAENPENTMSAVIAAVEQGYSTIELDVGVTADMKFVLMHDFNINRTARDAEGNPPSKPTPLNSITYEEADGYEYGSHFSKKFKGERLPLFSDVMEYVRSVGNSIKIDNKYLTFTSEEKAAFFELIRPYQDVCSLTCYTPDALTEAVREFPQMSFHYDGIITYEVLEFIEKTVSPERITIWLPMKTSGTTWVRIPFADEESARKVKRYGKLGLWILLTDEELDEAEALGADIVETNGKLKPMLNRGVIPDMHTHSHNSHDSKEDTEMLVLSEIEKGTQIMALTDHCDVFAHKNYDVLAPIANAAKEIRELSGKYGDKILLLSGVEVGEGFWVPDVQEKLLALVDYDVILGSVHFVQTPVIDVPYSRIDFSEMKEADIYEFMYKYFSDMKAMLASLDFDILCHLFCPMKYIVGKYGRKIDITNFESDVREIFSTIIARGIALEINTSYLDDEAEKMTEWFLRIYHEMHGHMLTVGSDAHVAKNAAGNFERATALALKCGFRNIGYFENRKYYQCRIGEN